MFSVVVIVIQQLYNNCKSNSNCKNNNCKRNSVRLCLEERELNIYSYNYLSKSC